MLVVLIGELHGHAAAERVADDGDAFVAQVLQKVAQPAGERAERVVRARLVRLAVAEQVRSDDVRVLGKPGITGSHVALLLVIPWTSSRTGREGSPATRHATR